MGKVFCLIGKSNTGKDTLYKDLLRDKDLELKSFTRYTTRPKRKGEVDGVQYFFRNRIDINPDYDTIIESKTYETEHGKWMYYSVDNGDLDLDNTSYLVILPLDVFESFKEYFGVEKVVPIYLQVEDYDRLRRSIIREEAQESPNFLELCRRYIADEKDFSSQELINHGITKVYVNESGEIEKCVKEITHDIIELLRDTNQ